LAEKSQAEMLGALLMQALQSAPPNADPATAAALAEMLVAPPEGDIFARLVRDNPPDAPKQKQPPREFYPTIGVRG
jgi:hypothetical protein